MKKLFILFIVVMSQNLLAQTNVSRAGVLSATYVQACLGMEILSKFYCPSIVYRPITECIDDVAELYPKRHQAQVKKIMEKEFKENLSSLVLKIKPSIEVGYQETLIKAKGDNLKTCRHFYAETESHKKQIKKDIIFLIKDMK